MHQRDLAAEARKEVGLFHGRIAAADHHEIGRASCRGSDWSSDVCSSDLMIFEARNSSRRCTSVTSLPKRERKLASSMAESPPPITMRSEERRVGEVTGVQTCALPIS